MTTVAEVLPEIGLTIHRERLPSTFFGDHIAKSGRMYGKGGQLEALGRCFRRGLGIRAAAKHVGCAKDTARKLYAILQQHGADFRCGCGKELAHRGTCPVRWPLAAAPTNRIARRRATVRRATRKWYAKKKATA